MDDLSLYYIAGTFPTIMEMEEIPDEVKSKLVQELTLLLQQKSQNIIGYTRNIELTIEAMKTEEKRISEKRKVLENKLEKFKEYVKNCMEQGGFTKVDTGLGTLTIAKNPMSVEVENEIEVPDEFKIVKSIVSIDKTAIKNHFKETGEILPGIKIIDNKTSLRIK